MKHVNEYYERFQVPISIIKCNENKSNLIWCQKIKQKTKQEWYQFLNEPQSNCFHSFIQYYIKCIISTLYS